MTTENNKQLMQSFVEFINTANEQLAQEFISPDATFYVPGQPEPMYDPDGYLTIIRMMRSGFPDIQWSLEDNVVEENKIAARFIMTGSIEGPLGTAQVFRTPFNSKRKS